MGSDTIKITIGYGIAKINLLNWTKIKSVTVYIMACCVSGGIAILQSRLFPEQIESTILLYNSPLIIIASLGLFNFFLNLNVKFRMFSLIAPHVFTVYLLNDHPMMRSYFWDLILKRDAFSRNYFMILHYIVCVIAYVIVGVSIDIIGCHIKKCLQNITRL